jgi:hypothetical protein
VYNIISDAFTQIHSRFTFLDKVDCPIVDGRPWPRCFNESGTYFGAISVLSADGDELVIIAGSEQGFLNVTLNGKPIAVGEGPGVLELTLAEAQAGGRRNVAVYRSSARSVVVHIGLYQLWVDNVNLYLDLSKVDVTCWECMVNTAKPEGLLGRTWDQGRAAPADDEVDLYREQDDNLVGAKFHFNKFEVQFKVKEA